MTDHFVPSRRYVYSAYWWVATELVRRNPHLSLVEEYPMDGFYDNLTLRGRTRSRPIHIAFNRNGSVHVLPDHTPLLSSSAVVGHDDPHWAVKEIERVSGLEPPTRAPVSDARVITFRLMARVLNHLVNDRSIWTIRMVSIDDQDSSIPLIPSERSADEKPSLPLVFPTRSAFRAFMISSDLPERFEYGRLWALERDGEAVAVFDTTGYVHTASNRVALEPLHARSSRSITRTMVSALADILP